MLKKRMLLLGAALTAFGAMMVGGAFATPTAQTSANSNADSGGPLGNGNFVIETPNVTAAVSVSDFTIAPTGVFEPAGTLSVSNHTSYAVEVTDIDVAWTTSQCGANPNIQARFTPSAPGDPDISGNTTRSHGFDVALGPSADINNGCNFFGTVTVTVEQDLT